MEQQQIELTDEQRIKRAKRGCFIALMPLWVFLSLAVIIGGMFLLGKVERDTAVIEEHVATYLDMKVPEGFYAYSRNRFLGTEAISYYHKDHLREDGRTTSVISIQKERSWKGMTLEEMQADAMPILKPRLKRREFEVEEEKVETRTIDGEEVIVYCYMGRQLMDEDVLKATACFRFMMGPDGPFQLQSMGLNDTFPVEAQIEALAAIKVKTE